MECCAGRAARGTGERAARLELTVTRGEHRPRGGAARAGPAAIWPAPGTLHGSSSGRQRPRCRGGPARCSRGSKPRGSAARSAIVSSEAAGPRPPAEPTLAESWDAALANIPSDWSDLVGEIELISSDYLDQAALQLAPINPRLTPPGTVLRFRCASKFGYGATPGMVRRCLERCDAKGIRGSVRITRALSDTKPVATQGPIWQIDGRTV